MKKYNIIYADPPWPFNNKRTGGSLRSGADAHYDTMTIKDICKLPIANIAEENAVLLMWWVASQPVEAIEVVKSWGFTLKTMTAYNWVKKTKHGKNHFGMGFWTRAGSELCLLATKGKPKAAGRGVRSVVEAENTKHSKKPDCIRESIVELCGDLPRVELFARERFPGWHAIGFDVDGIPMEYILNEPEGGEDE